MQNENFISSQTSWHMTPMRWFVLFLACMFQFGSYFCQDFPSVLSTELQSYFGVNQTKVNLLYTYYSLPNVIMPLLGGILIDRVGIRTGLVGFYILLILGQGLCAVGAIATNFTWLYVGRFIFGLGGENCVVAQSTIVSKWFQGKELALALGLNITFARLGTTFNAYLMPNSYDWFGDSMIAAMFLGLFFVIVSWLDGMALAWVDLKSDQRDNIEKTIEQDKISFKDVKEFKLDFIFLTSSCLLSYTGFFLFQQNNVEMFKNIYGMDKDYANQIYSIPFYCAALLTPVFGILIDRYGRRTLLLIVSSILLFVVNLAYYLNDKQCTSDNPCYILPAICQSVLGIFYSLYAAVMWPCVPLCVPERTVGTAFGIVNAVQNIGLTIAPPYVGYLVEESDYEGYHNMMLFFVGISVLAFISNVALYFADYKYGGRMIRGLVVESDSIKTVDEASLQGTAHVQFKNDQ